LSREISLFTTGYDFYAFKTKKTSRLKLKVSSFTSLAARLSSDLEAPGAIGMCAGVLQVQEDPLALRPSITASLPLSVGILLLS
jgi:hypothetical protein